MGTYIFLALVLLAIIQFIQYKRKVSKFKYSENQAKIMELMTALDQRKQRYTDPDDRNILMLACIEDFSVNKKDLGLLDVAKKAVQTGIRVDEKATKDGRTALSYAVSKPYSNALAEFLIQSGADVLAKDNLGRTPLHYGAVYTYSKTFSILANRAHTLDPPDNDGNTPLMAAAERLHTATIRELIDRGANVKHRNNQGETAHTLAERNKKKYYKYGGNSARPDEYGKENHALDEIVRELYCLENDMRFKPKKYRPPSNNSELGEAPE